VPPPPPRTSSPNLPTLFTPTLHLPLPLTSSCRRTHKHHRDFRFTPMSAITLARDGSPARPSGRASDAIAPRRGEMPVQLPPSPSRASAIMPSELSAGDAPSHDDDVCTGSAAAHSSAHACSNRYGLRK
jgi:hypothetical protein